jgi:hypothetical protein
MIKNLKKDIKNRLGFKAQEFLLVLLNFLKRSQIFEKSLFSNKVF